MRDDGTFDEFSVRSALAPSADEVKAETPAQRTAALEYQSAQAGGDKLVADAQADLKTLDAQATAAENAATPVVYGPYLPGHAPQPTVFASEGTPLVTTPLQQKAVQARAAATAAKDKLATLEAVYGHADPADPKQDTIGTLQADFSARAATLGARQARDDYLKLLGDPKATADQIGKADDAWQAAVDQQTLMTQMATSVNADAALLQAQQNQASAQALVDQGRKNQSPFLSTASTPSFAPSALPQQPGAPATPASQLAGANTALDAAKKNSAAARKQLDQTWVDQNGGPGAAPLDVAGWLKKAGTYATDLGTARDGVTTAQNTLQAAKDGVPGTPSVADARIQLGAAQQVLDLAQARVDATGAMQDLRSAQLWKAGDSGQPPDLAALTDKVRAAEKKVGDLQGGQMLTVGDEKTLTDKTLPDERTALQALDKQLQAAKTSKGDASPEYRTLANQYDWLNHKIALQQDQVDLADAQRAALAAPIEYAQTRAPTGVDLKTRTHSDAGDSALTWGITPGKDGKPALAGLPSNIKPEDVTVRKDGDTWYVTFDKSSGAYAARVTGGRGGAFTSYVDGSNKDDAAIEKGHRYKLDADAAQLWEATNTNADVGDSALVKAQSAYAKAGDLARLDPVTDGKGVPVLGPGKQLSTSQAPLGPDGQPLLSIDFNVDQTAAKGAADTQVTKASNALAMARTAAATDPGDVALKTAAANAQSDYDLAVADQNAIGAVLAWQQANRARQSWDADQRAGRPATMCYAKTPQENADDLLAAANASVSKWRSEQQKIGVGRAQAEVDGAQKDFDAWRAGHAYMTPATASESAPGQALQAARARLDVAKRTQVFDGVTTAEDVQRQFIARNLKPGEENDPRAMYRLFMQDPKVMAQAAINAEYARNGGLPVAMSDRNQVASTVAAELGLPADATSKVVDQIVSVGGDQARITVLPVVYALDADKDKGGGIVKTALFKVQDKDDPTKVKYVDDTGERYDSVDDFRANNNLPVDGVNLAMPEDGDFKLDGDGNVKLFTGDARTETGWETFKRKTHFDTVLGVAGLAAGIIMEVGSAGVLTEIAAPLMVASTSLYFAASSAQNLQSRADHGLSINPLTDRDAGMDWLNLGASVVALPGLGSSARMGSEMVMAERGGVTTFDRMAVLTNQGRLVTRSGEEVTDLSRVDLVVKGSSRATELSGKAAQVLGVGAMADGGIYMAQNWDQMSSGQKWEQGTMFLANLGATAGAKAALNRSRPVEPATQEATLPASLDGVSFGNAAFEPTAFHDQTGLPTEEGNSGGIGAMRKKFLNRDGLKEFASAVSSTPRVKRHNTSSWITGRVKPADYARLDVPVRDIRSQHSVDGAAVEKTAARSLAVLDWLEANPDATRLDMPTLDQVAGSVGSVKVGWNGEDRYITLDGVGRVEAIRTALDRYGEIHGAEHPLQNVEAYGVRLTPREYGQLYRTSTYFRDESGAQRAVPEHDLVPLTAVPRFAAGTALNLVKQALSPLWQKFPFAEVPDRRIPLDLPPEGGRIGSADAQGGWHIAYGSGHPLALDVNPTGSKTNCVNCAVTLDRKFASAGLDIQAVPSGPKSIEQIEALYGGKPAFEFDGEAGARGYLDQLADGSQGFVMVRGGDQAHIMNFRRVGGQTEIVDAQAGRSVQGFDAASVYVMVSRDGVATDGAHPATAAATPGDLQAVSFAGNPVPAGTGKATGRDANGRPLDPDPLEIDTAGANPTRVRLADWSDFAQHAPDLVEHYRPVAGQPAPQAPDTLAALMAPLTQSRVHGSRARFVVSDTAPGDAIGGGASIGMRHFKTFDDAAAAAAKDGGNWVYRGEMPQLRAKGQPVDWNVVGAVHVYADGSRMPAGIANPEAAAWTRPAWHQVAASAALGTAGLGVATYAASKFAVPHLLDDSLTLAAMGTVLRSSLKMSRFGHAGRWQSRYTQMKDLAGARGEFERHLNRLAALGGHPDLPGAVADFRTADGAISNVSIKQRRTQVETALQQLRQRAGAAGLGDQARPLLDALEGGASDKAIFDRLLEQHGNFAARVGDHGSRVARFTSGMARTGQAFDDQVTAVGDVLARWPGADDATSDGLARELATSVDAMHLAPQLRPGDTPVRRLIDGAQFATYGVALGYSVHDPLSPHVLSQLATVAFGTAFAADGVRIAGSRIANVLFRRPDGQPQVSDSKLYTQWLPAVDDSLTLTAGVSTLGASVQDLAGLTHIWHGLAHPPTLHAGYDGTFRHWLRFGVSGGYTTAVLRGWLPARSRNWADPAVGDTGARKSHLSAKVWGGLAAAALVADSAWQNYEDDKKKNAGVQGPVPAVTPTPTTPATPATPTTPHAAPGSTPPATPPRRTSPAEVVVTAGDARRATLWGIANANEGSLLTGTGMSAARAAGGADAETAAALRQLFQLNPQRHFRPALMDGVASAVPGDPDTIQPGWVIDVDNPAVS